MKVPSLTDCLSRGNLHSVEMSDAERLTRLEERYAHLQRHTAEQDKAMLELAEAVAKLRQEITRLRGQVGPARAADEGADERPPHY
jgi:SlyX protein